MFPLVSLLPYLQGTWLCHCPGRFFPIQLVCLPLVLSFCVAHQSLLAPCGLSSIVNYLCRHGQRIPMVPIQSLTTHETGKLACSFLVGRSAMPWSCHAHHEIAHTCQTRVCSVCCSRCRVFQSKWNMGLNSEIAILSSDEELSSQNTP